MELRKSMLHFFSEKLRPNQQIAVYGLTYSLSLLHPFTQDTSSLAAVAKDLLKQKGQPPDPKPSRPLDRPGVLDRPPGEGPDAVNDYFKLKNARREYNIDQALRAADTLAAFRELAESFAGTPGKKTVVWLTGDASPLNPTLLYRNIPDKSVQTPESPWLEMAKTYQALNASGMSIFPVDVRGVANSGVLEAEDELTHSEFQQTVRGSQAVDESPYGQLPDFRQGEANNAVLAMDTVAAETGAKVLSGRNDIEKLLDRAEQLWANYYVLSFVPENPANDKAAAYHHIEVKIDRSGARVLARRGYLSRPQTLVSSDAEIKHDLAEAAASPIDLTSVALQLSLENPSEKNGKRHFLFRITIGRDVLSQEKDGAERYDLSVLSLVKDQSDRILDSAVQRLRGSVPLAAIAEGNANGLAYRGEFLAPAKEISFGRVMVRDNLTGRIGTITLRLPTTPES